ncbi:putative short-chain oxidoreductase [Mycena sp. CBHHK59/15]|nr:putative short-chain oxidoreductase [Mycena sp. CBHHK59/15]
MVGKSTPVILVTGCSTGLGREMSRVALEHRFRVISTARLPETLVALKEKGAETLALDVTLPVAEIVAFAARAWNIYGQIDFLINNAGYLQGGAIEENSPEDFLHQFNTNVFGLVNIINTFLPYFRKRRERMIVNISSQGGSLNMIGAGIYCASKAAVDSLSDTYSRELAPFNVKCISIQPGMFRASVAESSNLRYGSNRIEDYDIPQKIYTTYNAATGTERGDPAKAAVKIIDFVTEPGRELPLRLPVGEDTFDALKACHLKQISDMEKFKSWSIGTDFNA